MPSSTSSPPAAQAQLRTFLADTDAPCPSCDYNLRGLTTDACPECNQRLTLRVGLAEPRQRAFIAALVGLAMGAGFDGLLLLYFAYMVTVHRRNAGGAGQFLLITGVSFLIQAPALAALIARRRAFQRRSNLFKGCTIALCWLITLIGFALFTAAVR
jgi:hypothetical protein